MGMKASLWAMNDAPTDDPREVLLLLGLANNAGADGRVSIRKYDSIAKMARCTPTTAKRILVAMAQRGVITRGKPIGTEHVWILPVPNDGGQA